MSDESHLIPPQNDIDWAIQLERSVPDSDRNLYMECMNGKMMKDRTSPRELRDGCILVGVYLRCRPEPPKPVKSKRRKS